MPIMSASEFEAIVSRIRMRVTKRMDQMRDDTKLREARRMLDDLEEVARDNEQLKAKRAMLSEAAKQIRADMPADHEASHLL